MNNMNWKKQWIGASILLATFLLAVPVLTPQASAGPVTKTCPGTLYTSTNNVGSNGALNNQSTVGPTFLVSFAVKNFSLVQPGTHNDINITNSQGLQEGHIHVFVDGKYVEIWANTNGIPLDLTTGSHTIKLQLVSDFHLPFSTDISASTTVTVANGADTIQSTAMNAQNYSLGALIVSVIALILVAYVAFKPKPKTV